MRAIYWQNLMHSESVTMDVPHKRHGKWKFALAALAALWAQNADAHHSFAKFNMAKLTTLTGTVREFTWANPHTWLIVVVRKADGSTEQWSLVGSSPNMMARWGWNAGDIKSGDKIVVDVHPGLDGRPIGSIQNVFLAKGKVLVDPAGSNGQALAGGPVKVPTKPQGQPYK
ncbi:MULTISPECIES: DUF6152 family protein [unclassified Novosphingobium]|uniref:DUF6152 family protein n=1 Tax=unclassified Novosphingobium TaxID=2644732 RepID=UPI00146F2516|nr:MULTISPECIES: DUF6152 family protein [unclassified Novosphingobium]NMN04588.1 hypothetical protein [Novosphingobium sp. SG919]NMN85419.1 hypothetical protein [Novosphingobium sp. SG916]